MRRVVAFALFVMFVAMQQLSNLAGVEGAVSSEVGCEALAAHVVNGG